MKHLKLITFLTLLSFQFQSSFGQHNHYAECLDPCKINDQLSAFDSANSFATSFGLSVIDDQVYVGLRLRPEIKIGKRIGFGFDIPIMFNVENFKFRSDEYTSGVGGLRMLRYFRFGRDRKDPIYFRIGDLSGVSLGYGSLINNYTNSPSFERRKMGLKYNFLIKKIFGIEGLYSDFEAQSVNLTGVRGYIRPLGRTEIPWAKTIEIGASYVQDKDNTSNKRAVSDPGKLLERYSFVKEGIRAWSFDAGVWFLNKENVNINAFAEFATLDSQSDTLKEFFQTPTFTSLKNSSLSDGFQNGQGLTIGTQAIIKLGIANSHVHIKTGRLWYSDHFLPQFFSSVYELQKDNQLVKLGLADQQTGTFGQVTSVFLDKIRLSGGVMFPDRTSDTNPAYLSLKADLINISKRLNIQGEYTKGNFTNLGEAFTFDTNSLTKATASYSLGQYINIGVNYYWTMTRTVDNDFLPVNYFTPFFSFRKRLDDEN